MTVVDAVRLKTAPAFSATTQAAVYLQAPAGEIGVAAGLQRTAQGIGSVTAAGLLALMHGPHATDHGLHSLVVAMGVLSALLFLATLFDRTTPRVASAVVPETAATLARPRPGGEERTSCRPPTFARP